MRKTIYTLLVLFSLGVWYFSANLIWYQGMYASTPFSYSLNLKEWKNPSFTCHCETYILIPPIYLRYLPVVSFSIIPHQKLVTENNK